MANHKSAAKRAKQNIVRNARNVQKRSTAKTMVKRVRVALEDKEQKKDSASLKTLLSQAQSTLTKAAGHVGARKRRASRITSRLARQINKSLQASA